MKIIHLAILAQAGAALLHGGLTLTLNKWHEPAGTSVSLGQPFTYVIEIRSTGDPNKHVRIEEQFPAGFVFDSATCMATGAAACPTGTLTPPTFGEFSVTGNNNDYITLRVNGHFIKSGSFVNTATAKAKDDNGVDLPVGNANVKSDPLTVPTDAIDIDVGVTKLGPTKANWGSTLHYSVTVKSNSDVFLGGILKITDVLRNFTGVPLSWQITSMSCTATVAPKATCPDYPTSGFPPPQLLYYGQNTQLFGITHTDSSFPTANDAGWMEAGSSFTVEIYVKITTAVTCVIDPNGYVENKARIEFSNGVTSLPDVTPGNDEAVRNTPLSGLKTCPPAAKVGKCQGPADPNADKCLSAPAAAWNQDVTYTVFVTNPGTAAMTNVSVQDSILKDFNTPVFEAKVTAPPNCKSGCSGPGSVALMTPTISTNYSSKPLWTAEIPVLDPGVTAKIEYSVMYKPVCETQGAINHIINTVKADSSLEAQLSTPMPEAGSCDLKVTKTPETGTVVLNQPYTYTVTYENNSDLSLDVRTVRDVLTIDSSRFGTLPIDYTVSCKAQDGSVNPIPNKTITGASIINKPLAWEGTRLIDSAITFDAHSKLICTVTITPLKPLDTNPYCQGDDDPNAPLRWRNYAWMDLSEVGVAHAANSSPPAIKDEATADLPKCRSVIVKKNAPAAYSPGDTITYTVTVENLGDDPVTGLQIKDTIQPPLIPISVSSSCAPVTGCTAGPALSGNQVSATLGTVPAKSTVTFTITAKAPAMGGSYPNIVTGSFPPGGNFYFKGADDFLESQANIQVVTPRLSKKFSSGTAVANGTATLTLTVDNTLGTAQGNISFVDVLPASFTAAIKTNSCGGTASIGPGPSVRLENGSTPANSKCEVVVEIKVGGTCGRFVNNAKSFPAGGLNNIDISGLEPASLEVTGCGEGTLVVRKAVSGAPPTFNETFKFLVKCQTPNGPFQTIVPVTWPTPGAVTVPNIPFGSTCTVTEGPVPQAPPGFNWAPVVVYSPSLGTIKTSASSNTVVARNTMQPCAEVGNVRVIKKLEGVPTNFAGKFEAVLQCLVGGQMKDFKVPLTAPGGLIQNVPGLPFGASCTLKETLLGPPPQGLVWSPPVYSPEFGLVTVGPACSQDVTVTNRAVVCCGPTGSATGGGTTDGGSAALEALQPRRTQPKKAR